MDAIESGGFMGILFQIVCAVFVFGFLIFIHELGHFTVGKLSGMDVHEFSIGMGPKLVSKQVGETLYALRLLPFGGFVAVEGEDVDSDSPRAFSKVALWKRILFVCAGAIMNLLLGFVILLILVGMRSALPTTVVGGFTADSRSAESLMAGDQILKVNGSRVFTVNDISFSLISDQDGVVDFTVRRDGAKMEIPGVDFGMEVMEDGTRVIRPDFQVMQAEKTFWGGVTFAAKWMMSIVRQVWLSFINLITGNIKLSELSGPVGVSTAIGQASTMGLSTFLNMVSFITVNLGVFNLLPLPALDGGRLVFLLVELVTRRRVNPKYEGMIHAVGLALLLGLVFAVSIQDILRLFKGM